MVQKARLALADWLMRIVLLRILPCGCWRRHYSVLLIRYRREVFQALHPWPGPPCRSAMPPRPSRPCGQFSSLDRMLLLRPDWDSYGADPPSDAAISLARAALFALWEEHLPPSAVVASAEGGVGIIFVWPGRYADIEFLNDGDILVSSYRDVEPCAVEQVANGLRAVATIREFAAGHATTPE